VSTDGAALTIVRIPEVLHRAIEREVATWAARDLETFLFLTLTRVETPRRRLYLTRSVVVLEEDEVVRRAIETYPTPAFCQRFYGALRAADVFAGPVRLAAVHSHPFGSGGVRFSGTDLASFKDDRAVFGREFGGVEFVGLVVNRDVSAFEGLVIEPDGLTPVGAVQVVGTTWRPLDGPGAEAP
jgi:hypothetical protein